jgi:hypothetical protein
MTVYAMSAATTASFRASAWEVGSVRASQLIVNGQQVVGARASAIADATGGATVDAEARATIEDILEALRGHGLIQA